MQVSGVMWFSIGNKLLIKTFCLFIFQTLPTKAPGVETVRIELARWEKNFIDVSVLKTKAEKDTTEISVLKEKITILERRVQVS